MRRYGLRDDQWDRIKHLLPGQDGWVGVTAANNRLFVEAVLYRYRAGIPWRDLPGRFGDPINVHRRFSRWAISGVWKRVFEHLAVDADNEYAMIDSTIVRAHQHSAGGRVEVPVTRHLPHRSHRAAFPQWALVEGQTRPRVWTPRIRRLAASVDMPRPALSPEHGLLLAFPSTGRLPSTLSATDLSSVLFEAS